MENEVIHQKAENEERVGGSFGRLLSLESIGKILTNNKWNGVTFGKTKEYDDYWTLS